VTTNTIKLHAEGNITLKPIDGEIRADSFRNMKIKISYTLEDGRETCSVRQ
jgi:hypothetical protein